MDKKIINRHERNEMKQPENWAGIDRITTTTTTATTTTTTTTGTTKKTNQKSVSGLIGDR